MSYSNMPTGPNYDFGGIATCKSITGFLPAIGEMAGGLVAIQHGNILKYGLITDIHFYEYPDEFMELLNKNNFEFIEKGKIGRQQQ